MATKTIGSTGDYLTASAWISYLQSDHGAGAGVLTEPEIAEFLGEDHNLSGNGIYFNSSYITTTSSNYVELRPASGARHNGTSKDVSGLSSARLVSTGYCVRSSIGHLKIHELEIVSNSAADYSALNIEGNDSIEIYQNVMKFVNTAGIGNLDAITINNPSISFSIYRNIIYGFSRNGIKIYASGDHSDNDIVCNTIFWCNRDNVSGRGGIVVPSPPSAYAYEITNNACINNGYADFVTNLASGGQRRTNYSSDGSDNTTEITDVSAQFQSIDVSNYPTIDVVNLHVSPNSVLRNSGTTLDSKYAIDIDGDRVIY